MARDEARVRVRLDTQQAKGDLRQLNREAEKSSGRVAGSVRRSLGRGFAAAGLGGAFGVGVAAVRAPTQSGVGDVLGEAFGGIGAQIERALLGELGEKARADAAARNETIQAFGSLAGREGEIPPGAQGFFDAVRERHMNAEAGRGLFERDAGFRSVSIEDLAEKVMTRIEGLLKEAAGWIAAELNPLKGWFK